MPPVLEISESLRHYQEAYESFHQNVAFLSEPDNLYSPIRYIMALGGKRIRPLLLLAACDAVKGAWRNHLSQAYALELFHNFTLVHDDIMDGATLRRGKAAVHIKYGLNAGILSGDAMMFYCQLFMMEGLSHTVLPRAMTVFNQTAIRIIEGQQMDMDFENRTDVNQDEYLKMIEYKTSVLLAAALQLGAILGGASQDTEQALYETGIGIGLAFQIRDDILDAFGDERFGKIRGGDILNNKKTLLYILARDNASEKDRSRLETLLEEKDPEKKINETLAIYERSGAKKQAEALSESLYKKALDRITSARLTEKGRSVLLELARNIQERKF
jgi:geranylgeranyl diphosphate synthase type II